MVDEHEEHVARAAVREALAQRQRDQVWLAREAGVDQGTVSDFLTGRRWPRLSTLAKLEVALGWAPGTLDRLARGTSHSGPMEAEGVRAMLSTIEAELVGATQTWADATVRLQAAQIAAKAAEDRRSQLVLEHARLTQRLADLQEGAP